MGNCCAAGSCCHQGGNGWFAHGNHCCAGNGICGAAGGTCSCCHPCCAGFGTYICAPLGAFFKGLLMCLMWIFCCPCTCYAEDKCPVWKAFLITLAKILVYLLTVAIFVVSVVYIIMDSSEALENRAFYDLMVLSVQLFILLSVRTEETRGAVAEVFLILIVMGLIVRFGVTYGTGGEDSESEIVMVSSTVVIELMILLALSINNYIQTAYHTALKVVSWIASVLVVVVNGYYATTQDEQESKEIVAHTANEVIAVLYAIMITYYPMEWKIFKELSVPRCSCSFSEKTVKRLGIVFTVISLLLAIMVLGVSAYIIFKEVEQLKENMPLIEAFFLALQVFLLLAMPTTRLKHRVEYYFLWFFVIEVVFRIILTPSLGETFSASEVVMLVCTLVIQILVFIVGVGFTCGESIMVSDLFIYSKIVATTMLIVVAIVNGWFAFKDSAEDFADVTEWDNIQDEIAHACYMVMVIPYMVVFLTWKMDDRRYQEEQA